MATQSEAEPLFQLVDVSVQPQMTQPHVTVVTTQPQATNPLCLTPVYGTRPWTTGVFDCFSDCTSCLCTQYCESCMECRLATRLGENPCLMCCVPNALVAMRTKVRTMGGIQGSICNDWICATCCAQCVMCQISRELDAMGV